MLQRRALDERRVEYAVHVYEPEGVVHAGAARLTWTEKAPAAAEVTVGEWDSAPPGWVMVFLERLLMGLPKKHAADGTWPRKISRWREAR